MNSISSYQTSATNAGSFGQPESNQAHLLRALQWVVLPILLIAMAEWSRSFSINGTEMSAIWPPAGIFIGACLALGYRALWSLVPALLFWSLFTQGMPISLAIAGVAGLTIGASLATWLIRRSRKALHPLQRLNHLPNLYFKGAIIGAGVSSLIGAAGYAFSVPESADFQIQDLWLVYWLFEALGVILFAPLFALLFSTPKHAFMEIISDFKEHRIQLWLVLSVAAVVISIIFSKWGDPRYAPVFSFALFPLICWYAIVAKPTSLHLWIPVFASVFVYFSIYNIGGLPPVHDFEDLLRVLLQVGILSIMAQLLGSINRHRNHLLMRFENQAKEDFMTGLANDRGIHEVLQRHITESVNGLNNKGVYWLAYIKLPDFNVVNELFGVAGTTAIELELAQQLQRFCPHTTIARLNQGKFAVLQTADSFTSIESLAIELYKKITAKKKPGNLSGQFRIAMGVIPINGSLNSPEQYLNSASHAARIALTKVFSLHYLPAPESVVDSYYKLAARFEALKLAIENDTLVLYGQEIRALQPTDKRISFEVLVRMQDTAGHILSPAEFIPAAEAYGLMPALDRWVIKNSIHYLSLNKTNLSKVAKCAINLSGASLSDPELASFIGACLQQYNVPACCITLEITETEAIRSPTQALNFIHDMHDLGCKVALDDFGTGLASFDYLRQYPFDELKIDGVFIRNLVNNPVDKSIVSAICHVAKTMKLQTVAEFVEDVALSNLLAELGVDFAQGYGIGKPQPLSELLNGHAPAETDFSNRSGHHLNARLSF